LLKSKLSLGPAVKADMTESVLEKRFQTGTQILVLIKFSISFKQYIQQGTVANQNVCMVSNWGATPAVFDISRKGCSIGDKVQNHAVFVYGL
jgi:hypothetical protein